MTDGDLVRARRTVGGMTHIDGRPQEGAERMPARWWSIQFVTSRLFYALVGGLLATRGLDPSEPFVLFGSLLAVAAVLFLALTAIALYYRRRWARDRS